jgi:Ala-tRNA(Pro) deacylase
MVVTRQTPGVDAGDLVEVPGRRLGDAGRLGEILEVLGAPEHAHYLVCWEDGHTSILYPHEGTIIRKPQARKPRRTGKRKLPAPAEEVISVLRDASVECEVLRHRRTTTAVGEADALGVLAQTVGKTLVTRDDEGACVRAVVPATARLDMAKLAEVAGATRMRLLSEEELLSAYPQFELGAVPPFAGPAGDRVVVDERLAASDHVVVEAGVHNASLRLRAEDLLALTAAQVADICT